MSSTTDLDTLLNQFTPQDVIGAIIAYSGVDAFPSDRQKLHNFVRLEKSGDGAELLKQFVFSKDVDTYPFSMLLESVLMQLQLGRWLSAMNPEYNHFGLTDQIREDIKTKVKERFSPEELIILEKIGKRFKIFVDQG